MNFVVNSAGEQQPDNNFDDVVLECSHRELSLDYFITVREVDPSRKG